MIVLKTKKFHRWAQDERVSDVQLNQAVEQMQAGLFDADLGSGLFKKRVARKGQGKRQGFRTLLAFKQAQRMIFIFGFAKHERSNIRDDQLRSLKLLADYYLTLPSHQITRAIKNGDLVEVSECGCKKEKR